MSQARRSVSIEAVAYFMLVLAAAWLRLSGLGRNPLTDAESLAALSSAPSISAFAPESLVTESPAYRALTTLAFTLSSADEAAARLAPAAAGLLLVLSPLLLRKEIGRGPALVAALLFAISPTLWLASRTASGTALGALSLVSALSYLIRARADRGANLDWAAASIGLGLVAGPAWLTGAGTVAAGWGLARLFRRRIGDPYRLLRLSEISADRVLRSLAIGGLAALGFGAGFGFVPDGFRGLFDSLGSWAQGWFSSSGQPPGSYLLHLVAYEPVALVFGGIGLINGLQNRGRLQAWLSAWALGALLTLAIYPSRVPSNAVWVVIPLLLLASMTVARVIDRIAHADPFWFTVGAGAAVLALLSFSYLQFRSYVGNPDSLQVLFGVPTLLALGTMGLGLVVIAVLLLGFGWSSALAARVAGLAGMIALAGFGMSAGAGLNRGEPTGSEIARPQVGTQGLLTLRESLAILSEAELGRSEALPVQVGDEPTPSLAWALRGYPRFRGLDPDGEPPVILVKEDQPFPGEYLGQSLTIGESRGWNGWLPPDPLAWLLTRNAPALQERWVMLVRQDVAGVDELVLSEDSGLVLDEDQAPALPDPDSQE